MATKKIIFIVSSANFYRHVNEIADKLEKRGFKAEVPISAAKMRQTGNYDVEALRSWHKDPKDFAIKSDLIRQNLVKIPGVDAILVVNDEKNGVPGYIGANVLIEMGLAFYLNKPIYVLNSVSPDTPVFEEIIGMNSIVIKGDLDKIKL